MANYRGYTCVKDLRKELEVIETKASEIDDSIIRNDKLIKEVKSDLKQVKRKVIKTKLDNFKKSCIKNIKIYGRILQVTVPYVISATLGFVLFFVVGDIPFYRQKAKAPKFYSETIDSTGIRDLQSEYTSYYSNDYKGIDVYVKTPWIKQEDGRYQRYNKHYSVLNTFTREELEDIVSNPKYDSELINLIFKDKNLTVKEEFKDELSNEDLYESDYIYITFRYTDWEDCIMLPQNFIENGVLSIIYLAFMIGIGFCLNIAINELKPYNLKDYVYEYKKRYKKVDTDKLMDLFENEKIRILLGRTK